MATIVHIDAYQKLTLDNNKFPLLYTGKEIIIRPGHTHVDLDDLILVSRDSVDINEHWDVYSEWSDNFHMVQLVNVKAITYKRLKDITDDEAIASGFTCKEALISSLEKQYVGLNKTDKVTIVNFNLR